VTIFVGGPLHGHDITVQPLPQTALETAADQPAALPATWTDPATAETYLLAAPAMNIRHPITGQPQAAWLQQVYVHGSLSGVPPEQAMGALPDAVMRWWFTQGTPGVPAGNPLANGHHAAEPDVSYQARCDCGDEGTFTQLARAQWMQKHIDLGHKPRAATPSEQDQGKG
jgi:hypothetical protein